MEAKKTKKQKPIYFVASLVSMPSLGKGMMFIDDDKQFLTRDYSKAYKKALQKMKKQKAIVAVLIYSEKTAIVIKRKWIGK